MSCDQGASCSVCQHHTVDPLYSIHDSDAVGGLQLIRTDRLRFDHFELPASTGSAASQQTHLALSAAVSLVRHTACLPLWYA